MYRLSAKQIIIIALISGIFAATAVAVLDRVAGRLQPSGSAAFSEKAPSGISDPATATEFAAWAPAEGHASAPLFLEWARTARLGDSAPAL